MAAQYFGIASGREFSSFAATLFVRVRAESENSYSRPTESDCGS